MKSSILLPLLALALPGCGNLVSQQSGDALKAIHTSHVAQLRKAYGDGDAFQQKTEAVENAQERNAVLNDLIYLIDTNYFLWEKSTFNKKAVGDFATDFTSSTLNLVSSLSGTEGIKTTLSAIAGGITSNKAAFNADILQNQSLLAIITKMRALRAEKLVALQHGMYLTQSTGARPLPQYSMTQGLNDLVAYYQAGTFVAAVQDIVDQAGAEKVKADHDTEKLKGITTTLQGIPE